METNLSWAKYELERLEENQIFLKRITLGLAVFGAVFIDLWIVYSTKYFLETMVWHPYPERIVLLLVIFIGCAVVINVLTVMLYLSIRVKNQDGK